MSQNLQNIAKFQKFQLENLVDFEKCCKTRICLQRSVPIKPKTSEQLPKIWQLPYGSRIVAKPAAALLFRRREAKVEEGPQDGLRANFLQTFANFWRARSRLYQNENLQENMRLTACCKHTFAPLQS